MRLEQAIDMRLLNGKGADCLWWNGTWHSREAFSAMVQACETSLREAGFSPGQRLCALMQNCPMIPALSVAVWRLGGSFSPLNAKAGAALLRGTIELIDPFAVVLSPEIRDEAGEALEGSGFPCATCPPEGPLPAFGGRRSPIESPEAAIVFATSGTTGNPKAVPLSHANLLDNCKGIEEIIRPLAPGDVFLNVLPNFHSFGYTISTLLPLLMDASQAIVPGFMPPQQTVRAIVDARVNVLFGVPAIFSYLFAAAERGAMPREALAEMKVMISGGDRLSDELHEEAMRIAGKDVMEGYGLTETSPAVAISRSYEEYRRGTVGPFLRGYEWRLCASDGMPADGNEGILWVRSPSVTNGYFRAPETTEERFVGGWFNTGDYVRVVDGYLEILDRVSDIIIVGGFNVHPQEVEAVLREHPAVASAIVVGMPHRTNGEIPKAFIRKMEDADVSEREIIRYCKEKLAHFKVPRKIEFVDDFPLSATGKILRRVLRERARERAA